MATIRASWKRVIRVAAYENETLELGVEMDADALAKNHPTEQVANLFRELVEQGDALVAERLAAVPEVKESRAPDTAPSRSESKRLAAQRSADPDPFV
jgi:hypothetical protein